VELQRHLEPDRPLLVVAVAGEAEHLSTDLPILITGVGKLASSSSVLSLLGGLPTSRRPSSLINLGTAGALHDGLEGTHVVGVVYQHDIDGPGIEELTGHDPAPAIHLGTGVRLATGDTFIADPAHRSRLGESADLVDMEGYAVASAARMLRIEVTLVKHVSDSASHGARRTWVESISESSRSLGEWLDARTTTTGDTDRTR